MVLCFVHIVNTLYENVKPCSGNVCILTTRLINNPGENISDALQHNPVLLAINLRIIVKI